MRLFNSFTHWLLLCSSDDFFLLCKQTLSHTNAFFFNLRFVTLVVSIHHQFPPVFGNSRRNQENFCCDAVADNHIQHDTFLSFERANIARPYQSNLHSFFFNFVSFLQCSVWCWTLLNLDKHFFSLYFMLASITCWKWRIKRFWFCQGD